MAHPLRRISHLDFSTFRLPDRRRQPVQVVVEVRRLQRTVVTPTAAGATFRERPEPAPQLWTALLNCDTRAGKLDCRVAPFDWRNTACERRFANWQQYPSLQFRNRASYGVTL